MAQPPSQRRTQKEHDAHPQSGLPSCRHFAHGLFSCMGTSTSSCRAGGDASKSDSCAANEAACWFGAGSGFRYNQVLVKSKSATEATASREANFGTASHVLAASVNSLSRAAMAAITRVENHRLASPA